jgi:hypothetical protein
MGKVDTKGFALAARCVFFRTTSAEQNFSRWFDVIEKLSIKIVLPINISYIF